jgi:hypothetical protein
METFDRRGIMVSIHDCAPEVILCAHRASKSVVQMYIPASNLLCGGISHPLGLESVDGQVDNWARMQVVSTSLLLNPHSKFFSREVQHCDAVRKWFHTPSTLGARLFHGIRAVPVAFHIRTFDGNDGFVTVSENFTIKALKRSDDQRLERVTEYVLSTAVSLIIQFARAKWKSKHTLTYVASDSAAVRRHLSKFTFILTNPHSDHNIQSGHRQYDTASLYDFHALSLATDIVSIPVTSEFSRVAACRAGAFVAVAGTIKELRRVLHDLV